MYSLDCYVGADERYRLPVRVYTEFAWHNLFAQHLFITPRTPVPGFVPEFTVVDAALFQADPERDGVPSSTFILVNFERRMILDRRNAVRRRDQEVGLHRDELSLAAARHAADALLGQRSASEGDVAIFFGLSGTGKTTLSSDPHRPLIGDDEHGWSDDGVFNFEGGCYAKVIRFRRPPSPRSGPRRTASRP